MAKASQQQEGHKHALSATKREVFGKKLKKLRKEGSIPANIFGPGFTSASVTVPHKDFTKVFSKAKETGIIYVSLGSQEIPVLARQVQLHPLTRSILHVDFRKVDLTQKIETEVPVKVIGESPAVEQKGGVLMTNAAHLLVESLPEDIPSEIEVDISKLAEIGDEIKVSDLAAGAKYQIKEEADKSVVSVIAHKEESLEPETTPTVTPEGEEGAAEGEAAAAAEGETPAEGAKEEPKEDKGGQDKKESKEKKEE